MMIFNQLLSDDIAQKVELLLCRGKALNVTQSYSSDAQMALAKAIKLEPHLVEAWVLLGECYWKHGEIEEAKNCFLGALNHVSKLVVFCQFSPECSTKF